MLIEVTAEDIQAGKRFTSDLCPIALAATRASGKTALVGSCTVQFWRWGLIKSNHHTLPPGAQKFVEDFDGKRPVQPFSFELGEPA